MKKLILMLIFSVFLTTNYAFGDLFGNSNDKKEEIDKNQLNNVQKSVFQDKNMNLYVYEFVTESKPYQKCVYTAQSFGSSRALMQCDLITDEQYQMFLDSKK